MKRRRRLLFALVVTAGVILVGYGVLRAATGFRLPGRLDEDLPPFVIFAVLVVYMYDRKLRADEAKAAKAEADNEANEGGRD